MALDRLYGTLKGHNMTISRDMRKRFSPIAKRSEARTFICWHGRATDGHSCPRFHYDPGSLRVLISEIGGIRLFRIKGPPGLSKYSTIAPGICRTLGSRDAAFGVLAHNLPEEPDFLLTMASPPVRRWSSQVFNWPLSALIKLSRIHVDYGDSSGPLRTMHWEITEDKIINGRRLVSAQDPKPNLRHASDCLHTSPDCDPKNIYQLLPDPDAPYTCTSFRVAKPPDFSLGDQEDQEDDGLEKALRGHVFYGFTSGGNSHDISRGLARQNSCSKQRKRRLDDEEIKVFKGAPTPCLARSGGHPPEFLRSTPEGRNTRGNNAPALAIGGVFSAAVWAQVANLMAVTLRPTQNAYQGPGMRSISLEPRTSVVLKEALFGEYYSFHHRSPGSTRVAANRTRYPFFKFMTRLASIINLFSAVASNRHLTLFVRRNLIVTPFVPYLQ
ncbi:hypothetical protein BJV77DRAFT_959424 [Russula vinacea]|nr:hypothetical protein BJV77DRAFT_959424 [Russula vinacea]